MDQAELDRRFDYHRPTPTTADMHQLARTIVKDTADALLELTTSSREQSIMLTKLEEALYWANADIARNQ